MKHCDDGVFTTQRTVAMVSMAVFLAAPGMARAQATPRVETVVTLMPEPNGQTENISEGPDGAIYVTAIHDRIVDAIFDIRSVVWRSPQALCITFVLGEEKVWRSLTREPIFPHLRMRGMHKSLICWSADSTQLWMAIILSPSPGIAIPEGG